MTDSAEANTSHSTLKCLWLERLRRALGRLRSEADAHGRSREAAPWAELAAALENRQEADDDSGACKGHGIPNETWLLKAEVFRLNLEVHLLRALLVPKPVSACLQPGVFECVVYRGSSDEPWMFLPAEFAGKRVRVEVLK